MAREVVVLLDDRMPAPPSVVAALGPIRFVDILRRRRRLEDELRAACASADAIKTIMDDATATSLARQIEDRGPGVVYLRLPTCIAPLRIDALGMLTEKARFALETTLAGRIQSDEAPAILEPADAVALLRATTPEDRRALLLGLSETAPTQIDHLAMVDLREPRFLLQFLSGATEARHFNSAEIDRGVFRKSSSNVAKMKAEHDFFHVAPDRLKRFLMPTFDFWSRDGRAGYSMEHVAVPDAALQFVHGAFTQAEFGRLLDQFFAYLASRSLGEADRAGTRAAGHSQIIDKMTSRLAGFLATPEGRRLDEVLRASGGMGGLSDMQARAIPLIRAGLERDRSERLAFSHGDACLSNILFDRRLGLMRLIDPRGASRPEDAMMHPLYDLAKLSHSILGGYDFINNDLFVCALDDELRLSLRRDRGGPPSWAAALFRERLSDAAIDGFTVRAVELSLFLSMLPLHRDRPRKLAGFALTAAEIIKELESTR